MTRRIPVIIDCDPGYDDALMLMLAFGSGVFDVKAVTISAGNQTQDNTLANALKILTLIGAKVPAFRGAEKPLCRELRIDDDMESEAGFGNLSLPSRGLSAQANSAVDGMAELLLNSNEKLTIVATGPLTNIAGLLQTHPQLAGHIERISLMGGGIFRGNVTPLAEFNIHTDPEAAAIVFHSGIPITMCGIDVTQKAVIFEKDIPVFRSLGNRSGLAAAELLQMLFTLYPTQDNTLEGCIALHDPCAIAWLMNPGIFTTKSCYVDVETKGTLTDGVTVVDFFDVLKKEPNTLVAYDIDRAAYVDMLYNAIRNLP